MATARVSLDEPAYTARFETRFNQHSKRAYLRYVILTETGEPVFDGYAGDLKEASDTVNAHIRRLNAMWVPPQVSRPAVRRSSRQPSVN